MPDHRSSSERRDDWPFIGEVMLPFRFLDSSYIEEIDLLDDLRIVQEAAFGREEEREPRPHDPFTSWVVFAHLGYVEEGGPLLDPKLTREQRLDVARTVLTEEEVIVVESIAVPKRYRELPARELEEMIRTAPDYIDRMWAACWLTLIGWTKSPECSFRLMRDMPSGMVGELEETITEVYAQSIGVTSRDDLFGWHRVDTSSEVKLVDHRLSICETHYMLNGPPPYENTKHTVPLAPGWKQVVQVVPEKPRY